jgi:cyclopropane-fatty-acyl-phospholipid synthase
MTYSCAIFPTLDADVKSADADQPQVNGNSELKDALYDAQVRKLQHIIDRADIRPGHRVSSVALNSIHSMLMLCRY